ncbi:GIY-YIG nuclease family protein [Mycoplasma struthionis]|uniref:Uncharacterized protein n=1 Tax=Mycoplasma struthionis TaxID=538220 RepID=A0A3G8LJ12_9MOLU|nr:hypothetical protein [Mycoplasma struthionis]AZG68648.1 hypothetical protein EGN60_01545 [Mycoplasma struthionis]
MANKNDKPFTLEDVKEQPELKDFKFEGIIDFQYICKLKIRPLEIVNDIVTNEKILAFDFVNKETENVFKKSLGVVYMITCVSDGKEHIIKFGQTRTTFKERLNSYNCGTVTHWRTVSTTNIKIVQSMITTYTTQTTYKLYIYDCSDDFYSFNWHGVESKKIATPKSIAAEDIIIKKFVEAFSKKPLANVHANATAKKENI